MSTKHNQADLDRLGIDRDRWDAFQARLDAETPIEVRVAGGVGVLRDLLRDAGVEYEIVVRSPKSPARTEFLIMQRELRAAQQLPSTSRAGSTSRQLRAENPPQP